MKIKYCEKQMAKAVAFVNKNNPTLKGQLTLTECEEALVDSCYAPYNQNFYGMFFHPTAIDEGIFVSIFVVPEFYLHPSDVSILEVDVTDREEEFLQGFIKDLEQFAEALEEEVDQPKKVLH